MNTGSTTLIGAVSSGPILFVEEASQFNKRQKQSAFRVKATCVAVPNAIMLHGPVCLL